MLLVAAQVAGQVLLKGAAMGSLALEAVGEGGRKYVKGRNGNTATWDLCELVCWDYLSQQIGRERQRIDYQGRAEGRSMVFWVKQNIQGQTEDLK